MTRTLLLFTALLCIAGCKEKSDNYGEKISFDVYSDRVVIHNSNKSDIEGQAVAHITDSVYSYTVHPTPVLPGNGSLTLYAKQFENNGDTLVAFTSAIYVCYVWDNMSVTTVKKVCSN